MIRIKKILPKKLNINAMYGELMEAMNDVGDGIQKDFEGTIDSWLVDVDFTKEVEGSSSQITAKVSTDNEIYGYINNGTSVRHALMSRDWKSKSTPGLITSGAGGGHVILISKKINRPGIKARNFDKNIAKIWKKEFSKRINKAMRDAKRASGHEVTNG